MIIEIDTNTGLVKINQQEKGYLEKTIPNLDTPIQYNKINIKRKYYKKTDPEYHRKPRTKKALKISKFGRIVKQEPLLELH